MKIFPFFLFLIFFIPPLSLNAKTALQPTLALEEKIAYQQGQFGALYERCGTENQKMVISGSLVSWRAETFRSYNGTKEERTHLEKVFDAASKDIALDANSCRDWIKAAAATWQGIIQLSRYGTPVASDR